MLFGPAHEPARRPEHVPAGRMTRAPRIKRGRMPSARQARAARMRASQIRHNAAPMRLYALRGANTVTGTCTRAQRARCSQTATRPNSPMPLEFAQRLRRIPVYPVAAGYDLGREVALMASNESPFGPVPEVFEAVSKAMSRANRYP